MIYFIIATLSATIGFFFGACLNLQKRQTKYTNTDHANQ